MAYGISKRVLFSAIALLALISITAFHQSSLDIRQILHGTKDTTSHAKNTYGQITNKVAVITDTNYTPRLIPLILHFHAVLGPDWPIILYTTQRTITEHFQPGSPQVSAIWLRAIEDQRIQIRTITDEFDLTSRDGVNIYMSRPWLWEQLAPAQHVLIFQADAMLCSNAHRTVDDFLQWDFIGAPMDFMRPLFNGGLSLRNRTFVLDVLKGEKSWEEETKSGEWKDGGEDDWLSKKLAARGAHLPSVQEALQFAVEFRWNIEKMKEPLGYHKVHKLANKHMDEITQWCPEISLAAPGLLE